MSTKLSYFLILCVVILFGSCLKIEEYPDEPILCFTSIEQQPDSITLNFSFTDGDGNFGLEDGDTLSPFNVEPFKQNLIVHYYELQNGEWQRFGPDFPQSSPFFLFSPFSQRVDWVRPSGQIKAQVGELSYGIGNPYYVFTSDFDTCRYEVYLYDRDLNQSNIVYTTSFLKPQ